MNQLSIEHIRKTFKEGKIVAVDDISFDVKEGAIFGLVGRNGAGKTTTIRSIMNIYQPDSGKILLNGKERGKNFHKLAGYLPEERGLYQKSTVIDNLEFLAEIRGIKPASIKKRINELLERFELADKANELTDSLSKGNQQKVQFIGTILHDPDLVILDEPFSGLDPVNTNILKDMVLELRNAGKLVMLSTHVMDMAERMCDQVALVHKGRLALNGSVSDIKSQFSKCNVSLDYEGDISFLHNLPYVHGVEDFGKSTSVEVTDRRFAQPLLGELLNNKVVVNRFESGEMSLHDIFVKLTGEKKAQPVESEVSSVEVVEEDMGVLA